MNIDDYVICTAKVLLTIWYLLLSCYVIMLERAILLMISGEIKVIVMVSENDYWYQGNKSYSQVSSIL